MNNFGSRSHALSLVMESELEDLVSQAVPPSEVHHTSKKGKSESAHSNKMSNYSSDPSSFMPEHELVELLWENGQIVMQGQSNRTKKSSVSTEFGFNGRFEEKFVQNGAIDSVAHDLHPTVPSAMNDQVDDAAPWLNYTIDDSIQNDFEFFSEISGSHMPSLSNANSNLYLANKSNGFSQATKDSHVFRSSPGASDTSRIRCNNLLNFPQHHHNLSENAKPRVMDVGNSNHFGDLNGNSTRFQKPLQQSNSGGFMNFPHFSRPVSLVKSNLHNIDKLRSHEKFCTVGSSYPMESTVIESRNGPKVDSGSYGKTLVDDEELVQNSSVVNIISSSSNCQASCLAKERKESERGDEAVVASSSVCSGHDAVVAASNDPKHRSKKRAREGEESEEESDDVEEELFAAKKPSSVLVTSGKRSRAAEVHNLSERRRRDRINEKMKALQELIPNCNKVDKASMLDEAIEYLKSLQLQIQIMSMGNGLFMPPMMLPAGMNFQHLRAPPISHLSPLGVGMGIGMGMGLGFGMGMIDLNGSPGLIPVPPLMPGAQFPYPVPAAAGFHGIAGQRFPVSVPHASSLFNSQAGISPQNPLKASEKDPSCSNNQRQQCANLEGVEHANSKEPEGQASQAVCQLMQKESKELNGRKDETMNPGANSSKATLTPEMVSWIRKMRESGIRFSIRTFNSVLNSCPTIVMLTKNVWSLPLSFDALLRQVDESSPCSNESLLFRELVKFPLLSTMLDWSDSEVKLDLHGLHLVSAYMIILQWKEEVRSCLAAGKVAPLEFSIVCGSGKHSKMRGQSPVKKLLSVMMFQLKSPLKIDRKNVGRFVAKGKKVRDWLC